jgi:hypothetical protein
VTRVLSAFVALVLMAAPAAATAQEPSTNAPPGNSAIDEYLETVPGATGNQRPRAPAGGSAAGALTPAQRARLQRLGSDGRILVGVVDATSPARTSTRKRPTVPAAAHGRSPLGEVIDAAAGRDGGAGMGVVLPAILLASLLVVVALVVARRRSVP